jgi:thioredoxin reductase (NADPH)
LPIMLVVDDDLTALQTLEGRLARRYGFDYQVMAAGSPTQALADLERWRADGRTVALLIAFRSMAEMDGVQFLIRAHAIHPPAKRALLIAFGDATADEPILQAMTLGQVDHYFARPWEPAEERLYPVIAEMLGEWVEDSGAATRFEAIRIVGPQWAPRCHELRDLLERSSIPYGFYSDDSTEGQALIRSAGRGRELTFPLVLLWNDRVLLDPSDDELFEALGVQGRPMRPHYDVAIVGAGPAGLAVAVNAASEGLRTVLVEQGAPGGQAGSGSLIRNYLGFPRGVSGRDLMVRASEQAWLFGAEFVVTAATGLASSGKDHLVTLASGAEIVSTTVVIATGVGYRRHEAPGLDALTGAGVFYGAAAAEARALSGEDVFVVGGGNSAGQAARHLARYARHVTLLVRSVSLSESMSHYLLKQIENTHNITVRLNTEVVAGRGDGRLEQLTLRHLADDTVETVPAAALFLHIGAIPRTGWLAGAVELDGHGFVVTGRDVAGSASERTPLPLETSMPGVFAAGDVRRGSVKRVASAVGEGAMVVQALHEYMADS